MDPLRFTVAAVPMAVYLLVLALLNLRQQPFVTTGARDSAALGIGLMGLIAVGPMELFFPEAAAIRFGPYVWVLLIIFYGLCISLVVLLMRPRIVIYNTTIDQLRPIITQIANSMDQKSRWTSDSMVIPSRKVHFHLESVEWLHNVQIIATGNKQSFDGWRELELRLTESVQSTRIRPNVIGVGLAAIALALVVASAFWMLYDKPAVAQALHEMLRR